MDQKEAPVETEICHNCKREVPQQNYVMHVAHCSRNMAVCPVCGDAFPKAHLQDHRVKQHALVECKDCRYKVQSGALEHHKKSSCGRRPVPCAYCELELPHSEMSDHENYCGSRTERCDQCGELVMIKYKKIHIESNHGFLKLNDEPGPTPSWELPVPTKKPSTSSSARVTVPARAGLATVERAERPVERNVNSSAVDNKADYKAQFPSNNVGSPQSQPPPQRQIITGYDATEDLRAKVKLVRHDLNEIKQSYLMNEERKERLDSKNLNRSNFDVKPTKKIEKFVTNLVPYEKNQSHKVNATSLEANPKNFYNYLGEKENPSKPFVPISNSNAQRNIFSETYSNEIPKTVKSLVKEKMIEEKHVSGAKQKNDPSNMDQNEGLAEQSSTSQDRPKQKSSNGAVPKRCDNGSAPRRRKAPPPPVAVPKTKTDDVVLPCEFCEQMIPACELVLHETGCRPDLAQFVPVASVPQPEPHSPDVELPCEFCFNLYPASKLLSHQQLCGA